MDDDVYEIFAIKYARLERRSSENFIGGDSHDVPMALDYFVWAIRNPARTYVLDTGFSPHIGAKRQRELIRSPGAGLKAIGIDPDGVTDVIISHMHYDHCGNHDLFAKCALSPAGKGDGVLHGPLHVPSVPPADLRGRGRGGDGPSPL